MDTPAGMGSPLFIGLFGPFDVRRNGVPIPRLRTRKGQWLLALLTLRHGREVERAWLAGTLWPDSSNRQAFASLRRSLADLRVALGPEASRLCSPSHRTVCLDLAGAAADVVAFDEALARGDTAAMERAIALYRGSLLEGCTEDWVVPEREAREQGYLRALETLAGSALARGDAAAAVPLLRLAAATEPLRESAQRALMEALAADGDTAAATCVHRDLRLLLHRELNAQPTPETETLFRAIRARAGEGTREGAGERSSGRAGDGDSGPLRPLARSLPSPAPPLARSLPPSNLPRPLTALVGREKERREIGACLARVRLVTLTGTGGVGKTRLAIQVAEEFGGDFPDGAWFVDLAALTEPALVPHAVASAVGVWELGASPALVAALAEFLQPKKLLLVLDNCEHLLEACARLVDALLRGCPHLRVLATSRQSLGLIGETAWRVPSLSLPEKPGVQAFSRSGVSAANDERPTTNKEPSSTPPPERLMSYEAVRLFVERAQAGAPGFMLTVQNAPAVLQVCRRLDGIPLALELAAARLQALSAEEVAVRLDDRFRLLTGGSRTALPRQQTLRATLDWSYDLLSAPERTLLRRLSVFAGGWTLDAAEAVCGDEVGSWQLAVGSGIDRTIGVPDHPAGGAPNCRLPTGAVLDLVTSLVDKSLVVVVEQAAVTRYRLLETSREYAGELLTASGETAAVRQRHAEYFLALAEQAGPFENSPDQSQWLERLETEHDNLRGAWEWSRAEESRAETGLRLAAALGRFWMVRGHLSEGRLWLEEALRRSMPVSPALRAQALRLCGFLAYAQGDYEPAARFLEESLRLYEGLGSRAGICGVLNSLGNLKRMQDDYPSAARLYEESRVAAREVGRQGDLAASLNGLGGIAVVQGRYLEAAVLFEESLRLWRDLGYRRDSAALLAELGSLAMLQGDWGRASTLLEECLALSREVKDRRIVAHALGCLGQVACRQGSYERAAALLDESLNLQTELGQKAGIAAALRGLAQLAGAQHHDTEARALYARSLAIRAEMRDRRGIAECLEGLARVAGAQGAPERAARLFGAAEALRAQIGAPVPPAERADEDRGVGAAQAALGDIPFASAWATGHAMTLDELLAEALAAD